MEDTIHLKQYQEEPSSEEDLAKLPMLSRKDMKKEAMPFSNIEHELILKNQSRVRLVHHDIEANGIDYITLLFNAKDIDTIGYMGLLSAILSYVDTKNFGFADEVTVVAPGINSKMDEIRAAYGLLNLQQVDKAIESRKSTAFKYRDGLKDIEGIRFLCDIEGVKHNYSYFPIFIDENKYGMSRDALYMKLKEQNILARRYFYPLISYLYLH